MGEPLRFHPAVAHDLTTATRWYDEISDALGSRFRHAVSVRLDTIEKNPQLYGRVQGDIRAARVSGFPFIIAFVNNDRATEIIGIFHTATDPDKLKTRTL